MDPNTPSWSRGEQYYFKFISPKGNKHIEVPAYNLTQAKRKASSLLNTKKVHGFKGYKIQIEPMFFPQNPV